MAAIGAKARWATKQSFTALIFESTGPAQANLTQENVTHAIADAFNTIKLTDISLLPQKVAL